jgi:TonB family protein
VRRVKPLTAALATAVLLACSKDPAAPDRTAPPAPPPAPAPQVQRPRAPRAAAPAPELTLSAFKSYTKKRSAEVRQCYESALANDQTLRGKVTLAFAILPGGGVSEVRVARSTFGSPTVPSCVAAVVRAWRTPFRPPEPVDVEYPLVFKPR